MQTVRHISLWDVPGIQLSPGKEVLDRLNKNSTFLVASLVPDKIMWQEVIVNKCNPENMYTSLRNQIKFNIIDTVHVLSAGIG